MPGDHQRNTRRRRAGSGPPAAVVMAWVMLTDPGLRSAVEYQATRAHSATQRVRYVRRRAALALVFLAAVALITRGIAWLML